MTGRNERGQFTAAETAYFESGGEADPFEADAPAADAATPAETATEPADAGATQPAVTQDVAPDGTEAPAEDDGGEAEPQTGTVPHQALHRERAKAKEAQAEVAALRERQAITEERMRILLETFQQAAARRDAPAEPVDSDPRPDPAEDIFAYTEWLERRLSKTSEQIQAREAHEQQAREAAAAEQAVMAKWRSDAEAFRQQAPDFGEAAEWLSGLRHKQLVAFAAVDPRFNDVGFRNRHINGELAQLVASIAQNGGNSAAFIYQQALAMGYTPKQAAAAAQPAAAAPAPPPMIAAPAGVVSPAAAEKMATAGKVAAAAKSLSAVGGAAPVDKFSVEYLNSISDKEFRKAMKELGDDGWRQLAGG